MARVLIPLGIALALVAALAATAAVLAYGTEPTRDGEVVLEGLSAPVTVAWSDSGHVWIEAQNDVDYATGLGYVHAADHAWTLSLWRQAAAGRLAEWLGDDGRALDLHARTLGLAELARQTYEGLAPEDKAVLDAYARGASRALAEPGVAQGDAFLVAGVVPEPWAPWDALAVERLHLYLSAPALRHDSLWASVRADSAVAAFAEADSLFRDALGMEAGGFDRVYAVGTGPDAILSRHRSNGSSVDAPLALVSSRVGGQAGAAATVPGTLMAPGGWSGGLAWGLLTGAPLTLERYAGAAPDPVYDRIVERDGDETLLVVPRDTSGLVLRPDRFASEPTADSTVAGTGVRVRWRGFRTGTDLGAFRALLDGRVPLRFRLLDGSGVVASGGQRRVLGRPAVGVEGAGFALAAHDTLAAIAARRLAPTGPDSSARAAPALLAEDAVSPWALARLGPLLEALGARDSLDDVLQTPYSYLSGWDGAYRPTAIAPAVFEWWLASHRDVTGHLPDPTDSLDVALLPSTLRIARAELRDRYGTLPSGWQWSRLQGAPRHPLLDEGRSAAGREFRRPLGAPGGHPTALRPGPALVLDGPQPGLALWTIWTRIGDGRTTLRAPGMRLSPSDLPDPAGDPEGTVLVLTPGEPLGERRLLLVPAS